MTKTITTKLDDETETFLRNLMDGSGRTQSEVVRDALRTAERARIDRALREESARLMADPVDVAESKAIAAEMGSMRSAW